MAWLVAAQPFCANRALPSTPLVIYRFRHALYRAVLYERLPLTRAALHTRIGHAEALLGEGAHERASELAAHFDRGGRPGAAATISLQAGEPRAAVNARSRRNFWRAPLCLSLRMRTNERGSSSTVHCSADNCSRLGWEHPRRNACTPVLRNCAAPALHRRNRSAPCGDSGCTDGAARSSATPGI